MIIFIIYKILFLSLFILLLLLYIGNYTGINMKCPICFKNGRHLHIGQLIINTNHGPKKNGKFEHSVCQICKNNPGSSHFHFCLPCK